MQFSRTIDTNPTGKQENNKDGNESGIGGEPQDPAKKLEKQPAESGNSSTVGKMFVLSNNT